MGPKEPRLFAKGGQSWEARILIPKLTANYSHPKRLVLARGAPADKGDRAESSEMKAYAYGPSGSVKGGEPIQWAATISLANGAGTADVHVQESEVAPLPDTACKQALEVGYRTAVRNERTKPFEENKHLPP